MPSPRKDSAATSSTAVAIPRVAWTTRGVSEFGRMRCQSRRADDTPRAWSAITKSCSRMPRTLARTTRAYTGMVTVVMARMALNSPGPRTLTMAMASSRAGKARSTSITRMMPLSTHPPKKPASKPERPCR